MEEREHPRGLGFGGVSLVGGLKAVLRASGGFLGRVWCDCMARGVRRLCVAYFGFMCVLLKTILERKNGVLCLLCILAFAFSL